MYHFIMDYPVLEGMIITKTEKIEDSFHLHVGMKRKAHRCPTCGAKTDRVHDYRTKRSNILRCLNEPLISFTESVDMPVLAANDLLNILVWWSVTNDIP